MGIDEEVAAAKPKSEHSTYTRKNADIVVITDDDDDIQQAGSALSQGHEDMHQWQTVRRKERRHKNMIGNKVSAKPKIHSATKSSQQGYKRQRVSTHSAKEKTRGEKTERE